MTTSLREIPGIGERMETHFRNIGVSCVEELVGRSPEELFELNCKFKGFRDDPCALYVFRLAVYYAENPVRDPATPRSSNGGTGRIKSTRPKAERRAANIRHGTGTEGAPSRAPSRGLLRPRLSPSSRAYSRRVSGGSCRRAALFRRVRRRAPRRCSRTRARRP